MDRDSGTWTRSRTERQGHNHRDWEERQEQVQRLRDTNRDGAIQGQGRGDTGTETGTEGHVQWNRDRYFTDHLVPLCMYKTFLSMTKMYTYILLNNPSMRISYKCQLQVYNAYQLEMLHSN